MGILLAIQALKKFRPAARTKGRRRSSRLSKSHWFLIALVILVGSAAAVLTARFWLSWDWDGVAQADTPPAPQAMDGLPSEFGRVVEVWDYLEAEHVDRAQLDPEKLSEGAIRGMLEALEDPYASFLDSEQFGIETQDYKGYFEGIGAQVAIRDGQLTIIAPMPGAPAQKAGILPGDVILGIDGESTHHITLLEAVAKIRGEKGTRVELLVLHMNETEAVTIVVERGVIPLTSVSFEMLDNGLGHLIISNFSDTTNDEVKQALEQFEEAAGVGLIVDLRNNPGGLLKAVVDVSSQFLEEGIVVYQIDSQGQRRDWNVERGGIGEAVPLVVLINGFSASASEVFSGAMIDHERATVVGTTSFGKGSVNTLRPLSDGSGIYFSIARWYTPKGTLIEGQGITPNIIVEHPAEAEEDVQLRRAIEVLTEQGVRIG